MTAKEILDLVSTGGALAFMVLAVWAFATGRVVPSDLLNRQGKHYEDIITYERQQKDEALDIARAALQSHDRIADAVEERNRLDRERLSTGGR